MIAALLVFVERNARTDHDFAMARALGRGGRKARAGEHAMQMRRLLALVDECVDADLAGTLVEGSPLVEELLAAAQPFRDRAGFQDRWLA